MIEPFTRFVCCSMQFDKTLLVPYSVSKYPFSNQWADIQKNRECNRQPTTAAYWQNCQTVKRLSVFWEEHEGFEFGESEELLFESFFSNKVSVHDCAFAHHYTKLRVENSSFVHFKQNRFHCHSCDEINVHSFTCPRYLIASILRGRVLVNFSDNPHKRGVE